MVLGFFTLVFLLCGLFYGYSYWKIIRAFRRRRGLKIALAGVAVLLLAMPFVGMWLERAGHNDFAWPVATIGFSSLVATGWFFGMSLATDLWNLLIRLIGRLVGPRDANGESPARRPLHWAILPPGWTVIAMGTIVTVGIAVSAVSALRVRPNEVVISVPNLPDDRSELVVAQVTDLHLGLNERGYRMRQVIDILERTKPDLIFFTGDNIDSPLAHVDRFAEAFAHLQTPLGKYAVLGNHEFYVARTGSLDGVEAWYQRAGFRLLRQESVRPAPGLLIAGVDDPARWDPASHYNEHAALKTARMDDLVLFLKHQPHIVNPNGDSYWTGLAMIQFSGHTHGGQIWPWPHVTKLQYPLLMGLYTLSPTRHVYVSPGAGSWGPPLRLSAKPEVSIVRLRKSQ